MPGAVRLERRERRPRCGGADLPLAPVVELEQLVRVAVLLVVVDQARIRRRGEDGVERPAESSLARVAVQDGRLALDVAHLRELLDPRERVERVAAEEADRRLDRPAVRRCLWHQYSPLCGSRGASRSKCAARRADRAARERITRRTSRVPVLRDQIAEREKLGGALRRVPVAEVAARRGTRVGAAEATRCERTRRAAPPRARRRSYGAVLTRMRRQLNAAMSTPVAS